MDIFDLRGARYDGRAIVHLQLHPGVGVQGPAPALEHLEGGPHAVPLAFAAPIVASGRGRLVPAPDPAAPKKDGEQQQRPPAGPTSTEHRDPVVPHTRAPGAPGQQHPQRPPRGQQQP